MSRNLNRTICPEPMDVAEVDIIDHNKKKRINYNKSYEL